MITLVYRYTCDACKDFKEELHAAHMQEAPPWPCAPEKWTWVPYHGLYCPKHNIVVKVTKRRAAAKTREAQEEK